MTAIDSLLKCLPTTGLGLAALQVFPQRNFQAIGFRLRFGPSHDFTRPIVTRRIKASPIRLNHNMRRRRSLIGIKTYGSGTL